MAGDTSLFTAEAAIWTNKGWTMVNAIKFEALSKAEEVAMGLIPESNTDDPEYIRICGMIYKDNDFDGVADDVNKIERGGGMIIDSTTLERLAGAITDAYNKAPWHKDESFRNDGYETLAAPAMFYTLNGWITIPERSFIEFYDYVVTDPAGIAGTVVHFCTDKYIDRNFDGAINVLDYGPSSPDPDLEKGCGIIIPRDKAGIGLGALAFATAITNYFGPPT